MCTYVLHLTSSQAFKAAHPAMPMPAPLDEGVTSARPTQFDTARMKLLGVSERPMGTIIADAIVHLRERGAL